jgi:hypothetical protein
VLHGTCLQRFHVAEVLALWFVYSDTNVVEAMVVEKWCTVLNGSTSLLCFNTGCTKGLGTQAVKHSLWRTSTIGLALA